MGDFPEFMKHPANRIASASQHTSDIEGYVFDGAEGSQMAFWTCGSDAVTEEHFHDFDEYFIVVEGSYTLIINGKEIRIDAGQEYFIPRQTPIAGRVTAGTRTIHLFGGQRAKRVESSPVQAVN
jgi:quercetin dioxygenase-like cupin family protein